MGSHVKCLFFPEDKSNINLFCQLQIEESEIFICGEFKVRAL